MTTSKDNKDLATDTTNGSSHPSSSPPTKNTPSGHSWTLQVIQEHAWRLSLLIAGIAVAAPKSILPWIFDGISDVSSMKYHSFTYTEVTMTFLTLLLVVWVYGETSLAIRRTKLPPGKLGWPLVGHTLNFIAGPSVYFHQMKQLLGSESFSINVFEPAVLCGEANDLAWLWNIERKGKAGTSWSQPMVNLTGPNALSHLNGKAHKTIRQLFNPAFAPKSIRDYTKTMDETVLKFLKMTESTTNPLQDGFHSTDLFQGFAIDLLFATAFGTVEDKVLDGIKKNMIVWGSGLLSPTSLRIPGTPYARAYTARENMLKIFRQMVVDFKKNAPEGSEQAKTTMMGRICYSVDEEGNPMKMETLLDNLLTIAFAGHDTTNHSMGTALFLLNQHPEIKKALMEEVQNFQEPLDFDEMKDAPVLNAFMAEAWRLIPPGPFAMRRITEDATFHNKWKLPKGQMVMFSTILPLSNEKEYPNPGEFSIARFLPKDHPLAQNKKSSLAENVNGNGDGAGTSQSGLNPHAMSATYPVFGGGNHGCLGSHFAKMEMRLFLTRLLQRYDFEIRNEKRVHVPINGWKCEFKLIPLNK